MMYHKDLPETWIEIIEQDEVLKEIWEDDILDESEQVPEFLFQAVRGQMERIKPIFALYGEIGLEMYEKLKEIDTLTAEMAELVIDGEVCYTGYFFTKGNVDENKDVVVELIKEYIKAMNDIYVNEFEEEPLMDENAKIEFLTKEESEKARMELNWHSTPECDMRVYIGDWFDSLDKQEDCEELGDMLGEALYHINNDYWLSYYIQWSMVHMQERENPFLAYYKLWCMGVDMCLIERDKVIVFQ